MQAGNLNPKAGRTASQPQFSGLILEGRESCCLVRTRIGRNPIYRSIPVADYYAPKSNNRNESHTLVPREHRLGDRHTCCVNYAFGHQNPACWTLVFPDIETISAAFCLSYVRNFRLKRVPSPPPYPPGVWFCTPFSAKPPHRGPQRTGDVTVRSPHPARARPPCEDFAMNLLSCLQRSLHT